MQIRVMDYQLQRNGVVRDTDKQGNYLVKWDYGKLEWISKNAPDETKYEKGDKAILFVDGPKPLDKHIDAYYKDQ
jgi:hypothetical protein